MRGRIYTTLISFPSESTIFVYPGGDKCILANPVFLKDSPMGNKRISIYDMERDGAKVRLEHDLACMKFRILTYHVEIKRT